MFTIGEAPGVSAALAGLKQGFRIGRMEPVVLESSAERNDEAASAALSEFAFERVDVVFAFGPEAAAAARDRLGTPAIVFAAVGYPEALGLPGRGNVCGVAGGVPAAEIARRIRRSAPAARTIHLVGADADDELGRALVEGRFDVRTAAEGATPPVADVVWLAPSVDAAGADAIARTLHAKETLLVGSRPEHVEAGCAVVIYSDPTDEGLLAAALAQRVLDGDAPSDIGVRRVARRRVVVNLDAARRLAVDIPLGVVATADRVLPALGGRR